MKLKNIVFAVYLFLGLAQAQAGLIESVVSVKCLIKDKSFEIQAFSFDLYATGFPMAGVGMYSGIFEAEAPGLNCHIIRGHIYTATQNGNLLHRADSNCLQNIDYIANVTTSIYESGHSYDGTLSYRTNGPLGSSAYKTASMTCTP